MSTFTKSSGNVFDDLGCPNAEEKLLKSRLIFFLGKTIKRKQLTQVQAAQICGTDQSRLSKILRGDMTQVTTDKLFAWLMKLGFDVHVSIDETVAPQVQGKMNISMCDSEICV